MPGDCSPSRSVVSKISTLSIGVPLVVRGLSGVFGQTKTLPARRHERVRRVPLGTRRYVRRRLWLRRRNDIGSGIIPQTGREVNEFRAGGCETATVKRLVRRGVVLGALAGLASATGRFVASRSQGSGRPAFEAQPFPMPPRPVVAELPAAIGPDADGTCPVSHPIKGKLSTGIYHRPGAFAYERTHADRCYRDDEAAEADGLRAAKR